jgi:transposase
VENGWLPQTDAARTALAGAIGAGGQTRLHARAAAADQPWLPEVPAVNTPQQVWAEQYIEGNGRLSWREGKGRPSPAELIAAPSAPAARYSTKREGEWVGSKVHLTATCETDAPQLLVNVETTPATTPADHMLNRVQTSLEGGDWLPAKHPGDKG